MKIYGGRRKLDKVVLNYARPILNSVKRDNNIGLQFILVSIGRYLTLLLESIEMPWDHTANRGNFGQR